ncbi:hypothetical protein Daus18300_011416 [Diaporthe australafricana]|uniref:Uncharacterized protein n=1 Tax=Diaporthe australafricana TaxID=127596 RepID=A0ABR3W6L8_9PEZI
MSRPVSSKRLSREEIARDRFIWMVGYSLISSRRDQQVPVPPGNGPSTLLLDFVAFIDSCLDVLLPIAARAARAKQWTDKFHCLLENPG